MSGYAIYVLLAYLAAGAVLGGLLVQSLLVLRRRERQLSSLRQQQNDSGESQR